MKQSKHYESKPPTDLRRPAPKEIKPINPVIMNALGKALFDH